MVIYVLYWNLFVLSRSSLKMVINWIGESVVSNSNILSSDGRGIFPYFLEFTIWKPMYIGQIYHHIADIRIGRVFHTLSQCQLVVGN